MREFLRAAAGLAVVVPLLAASSAEPQQRVEPVAAALGKVSAELTAYLDAEYRQELRDDSSRVDPRGRSEAMLDQELAWRRRSVAQMRERFDPALLSDDARVSYDLWALELERAEEEVRWRRHRYVFARAGALSYLPELVINLRRLEDRDDLEYYLARLARLAEELDQLLVRAKAAADDGIHMPTFTYAVSLDEIRRVVSGAPFTAGADCALFADAKTKINQLVNRKAITPEDARRITRRVVTTLIQRVKPAYDRVAVFLREDKAKGQQPDRQGALALPDGVKFYASELFLHTTTRMSAEAIHGLGLAEVARLREEMQRAQVAAGFDGTLAELFEFMRTDPRFFLPSNDAGAAEYRPSSADLGARHAHRAAAVSYLLPVYGVHRRLGSVCRSLGQGNGFQCRSLQRARPARERNLACDPLGRGHGHSCPRLDAAARRRIFPGEFTASHCGCERRGRALHFAARTGDQLQAGHDRHPAAA
jgi:uncharacterized protein (DUF885 family)